MDLIPFFIFCGILGWLADRKRVRDVQEGRIPGVRQSNNLFDWMFYYHD